MADVEAVEKIIHDFIDGLRAERRICPDLYAAELAEVVVNTLTPPPAPSAGGAVARAEALARGDNNWMDAAGPATPRSGF